MKENRQTIERRKRIPPQDRREAILQAAHKFFIRYGYDETSLDMILALSGGSKRSIYEQFGDKKTLFAEVAKRLMATALTPLDRKLLNVEEPVETLVMVGSRFLQVLTNSETIALLRQVIAQTEKLPDLGQTLYENGPERAYAQLAGYLQDLHDTGKYTVPDTHASSKQFFSLVKGDIYLKGLLGISQGVDPEEVKNHIVFAVRTFLRSIE